MRGLRLREAKFYDLFSFVIGPGRSEHRMHPIADAKPRVGWRAQNRTQRRAIVEDDLGGVGGTDAELAYTAGGP